ncbi:hypothetical protein CYLTODRAFT_386916 [Cylindrobasidium torrendii FP15055 ss-10]|uniref:Diphthamide biosynthesis protein 4 n=1 Tax=Cylindrobasidium torrendii FP15055 ss-10 TaxID=1314674 RepID=A0A0D7BT42_9AGAR|nr:hypothetical protein CYLTODRAFT_386916 [Cylindrobasidium torrendii FP15055 ss-10]
MLLRNHPDKNFAPQPGTVSVSLIKEAFLVLSDPQSRAHYDATHSKSSSRSGYRPAAIVSLDDFEEHSTDPVWTLPCRCGGVYQIDEEKMERNEHTVGCTSCSETVWVGYQAVEEG